jgi:hypothetical protein
MPVYDAQIVGYPPRPAALIPRHVDTYGCRAAGLNDLMCPRGGRWGQPLAAMSRSTANSVRTGTPVPPFTV